MLVPERVNAMTIELALSEGITEADYPPLSKLSVWADAALASVDSASADVSLLIASADEQQRLNRDFRGKDKPTNVLSFPTDFVDGVDGLPLGDIACCPDVIRREALEQGKALEQHWAHMIVHGVLHLAGYDHVDDAEAEAMEALEVKLLAQLGFDNPYA